MRAPSLVITVLLTCLSSVNYADHYTPMSSANSPPTTFENDPATSESTFSAEPVEQPTVTVPVKR